MDDTLEAASAHVCCACLPISEPLLLTHRHKASIEWAAGRTCILLVLVCAEMAQHRAYSGRTHANTPYVPVLVRICTEVSRTTRYGCTYHGTRMHRWLLQCDRRRPSMSAVLQVRTSVRARIHPLSDTGCMMGIHFLPLVYENILPGLFRFPCPSIENLVERHCLDRERARSTVRSTPYACTMPARERVTDAAGCSRSTRTSTEY